MALQQMSLLKTDHEFRQFVIARALLLSIALSPPFYVLVAQASSGVSLAGLGALIIANGLASSISAPFWGYLGDRSSKQVMMIATVGSSLLGFFTVIAVMFEFQWITSEMGFAVIFLVLNVLHGGARLGRKVYLVDMASGDNRAAYVAVSNTVIGILMLAGGLVGIVGDIFGPASVILLLAIVSLLSAAFIKKLPDVSDAG